MINRVLYNVILGLLIVSVVATVFFWWWGCRGACSSFSSLDNSVQAIIFGISDLVLLALLGLVRFYRGTTNVVGRGFILALGIIILMALSYFFVYLGYIFPKQEEERNRQAQERAIQRGRDECEEYKIEVQIERTDGQVLVPPPGCI